MDKRIYPLLITALAFWSCLSYAQPTLFDIQHISTTDGLDNLICTHIQKDQQGHLWIYTPYGFSKYDGYTFNHIRKEAFGLIKNQKPDRINEDDNGNFWIFREEVDIKNATTTTIVTIFDPKHQKNIPIEDYFQTPIPFDFSDIDLDSLTITDAKNRLWIVTKNGQLYLYEQGKFKKIFEWKNKDKTYRITIDNNDNIWIISRFKLLQINRKGKILAEFDNANPIYRLWTDKNNTIWKANYQEQSKNKGILSIWSKTQDSKIFTPFVFFNEDNSVYGELRNDPAKLGKLFIHRDSKGYWYLKDDNQFHIFDNQGIKVLTLKANLGQRPAAIDYIDYYYEEENQIWFSTNSGLIKINSAKNLFRLLQKKEGLSDARGITEDAKGNIYFIDKSLFKWHPKKKGVQQISSKKAFTHNLSFINDLLR